MDEQRLDELEKKIDLTYRSVEKVRKYLFYTFVVTVVLFVLPLVGLLFAVPTMMSSLSATYSIE